MEGTSCRSKVVWKLMKVWMGVSLAEEERVGWRYHGGGMMCDGFGGDIQVCIIAAAVEDLTKWGHVWD